MTANLLLNLVWDEARNLSSAPGDCKRVRFRKSVCRKCVEFCPEDAILLNPGPTITSKCSGCCLCLNSCPTGVFRTSQDSANRTLFEGGISLARDSRQQKREKRLLIHCGQAEDQDRPSFRVRCLGSLTENSILGAVLAGFEELILVRGDCSQCHLKYGDKLIGKSVAIAEALLASIGLNTFTLSLLMKKRVRASAVSRREIFSRFYSRPGSRPPRGGNPTHCELPGGDEGDTRHSTTRNLVRRLLEYPTVRNARSQGSRNALKFNPEFPWAQLRIDEKECSACGICCSLCPTGAISMRTTAGYDYLYFDGSSCNNCALCKEGCPENVIDFEENLAPEVLVEQDPQLVATVKLDSCVACGERIAAREGDVCSTCRKRQVQPQSLLFHASSRGRTPVQPGD